MKGFELYWEVIRCLSNVIEIIMEGYFFYRFLRPFLEKRYTALWTGFAYFGSMLLLWLVPWEVKYLDLYGTAVAFVVMYLLDHKRNLAQKIFLSVTGNLLFWVEFGFALIPWNVIFTFVLMTKYMQEREWLLFFGYVFTSIVHCVLQGVLLHFMVKLMHRVYVRKEEDVTKKELGLLLLPLLTVFVGRFILAFAVDIYLLDTGQYIWNVHGEFKWLKILYQIISFSAVLLTVVVYQKIRDAQQREKEDAILTEQERRLEMHIREVEGLYSDLRGLRHDMGNHVVVLENLFFNREEEELKQYFKKLKEEFLLTGGGLGGSGNPVTDIILAEKKRQAQVAGIDFESGFHYPQDVGLNAFDVSVILNNALDNALEAAEIAGVPYVKIRSWRRKKVFMIEVENSFSGILKFDGQGGMPQSTKQDGGWHGFGLANIRRVAQKYCGDVDIIQEKECVRLNVMLILGDLEDSAVSSQQKIAFSQQNS
ncbi:MAG: GHKL domain-containing protein [Lachnospiraceae bacterium]|nr:GHKL domain-containing protein [Lachnospiraceae bacterium]